MVGQAVICKAHGNRGHAACIRRMSHKEVVDPTRAPFTPYHAFT
uniref:Uncharacterized protein n=1 Tax=Rhizophora mucronata TaxID=61149 RepID=A0A2P2Q610_RHIMU